MKKLIYVGFICFCFSTNVFSASQSQNLLDEIQLEQKKVQVLNVMKKYSETVSCDTTFAEYKTSSKDVFYIGTNGDSEEEFFVLWGGNLGCYRSATGESWQLQISKVILNKEKCLVSESNVFGFIDNGRINYSDITSIKEASLGKYEIISTEYDDSDFTKNEYGNISRFLKDGAKPKNYKFLVKVIDSGSRSSIIIDRKPIVTSKNQE